MARNNGRFVWYELTTSDTRAAESFYRNVFGWEAKDSGMPDMSYTLLSAGPIQVAGMFAISPNACGPASRPGWLGYVAADVDADAARIVETGGQVYRPPHDIPGVGRFAVVADPYGAPFALFSGTGNEAPPLVPANTPGHVGWHELHAGNGEGAFAFYSGLFGWTQVDAMDMGPMGAYRIFAIGGVPAGGMMTKTPQMPAPRWLFYVNVDAIDAALKRAVQGGGQLIMGPHEVPGGSWIVQCTDPQGAMFAMVGPRR